MKKTRKLLFVLTVLAACALLFGATALAEGESDYVYPVNTANSVTFSKSVDLINEIGGNYYGPDITYTYSVRPATAGELANIIDDEGNQVAGIKVGPADSVSFASPFDASVTTGSIVYSSEEQTFSAAGTPYTKTATLNFDTAKFTAPGVYRYVLTDTTAIADLYAAGIVRPENYDGTLYLDVYVASSENGYGINGAVLVTDKNDYGDTDPGTVTQTKTDGFDGDEYCTVNVIITKTVTGGMGDKNNDFPFIVTVNNNPSGNPATNMAYYIAKGTTGQTPGEFTETTAQSNNITLKHGETFYIRGLNPKATVNVTETNNTNETYKVTVISPDKNDPWVNKASVAPNGTQAMSSDEQAVTNYDTDNSTTDVSEEVVPNAVKEIDFENNCDTVSPTGLALRYGPFILLLIGAICFVMISRRRKETKEDSDSI